MSFGSVQIINRLVRSRCLHYLPAVIYPPTWRLHTGLYNFAQNISTNIQLQDNVHTLNLENFVLYLWSIISQFLDFTYFFFGLFYSMLCDNAHHLLPAVIFSDYCFTLWFIKVLCAAEVEFVHTSKLFFFYSQITLGIISPTPSQRRCKSALKPYHPVISPSFPHSSQIGGFNNGSTLQAC